jgi:putative ABC transport system substrate-binding protein
MRRREFIALAGASVAWPFAAIAQEAGRKYRIGFLLPLTRDASVNVDFLDRLRRRGFIEGQNLTVEWRAWGGYFDLIPQYAAELVNAQVDVIVAVGDDAVRATQQATKTIPIVGMAADMLGSGLVTSLARPNTGVSAITSDTDGKRQDILIEAVPGLRRMAALADTNTTSDAKLNAMQEAARARDIELSIYRIAKGEEIVPAIHKAQASGAKRRSTCWRRHSCSPIVSLLWIASPKHTCPRSTIFPKELRKVDLPPMGRVLISFF